MLMCLPDVSYDWVVIKMANKATMPSTHVILLPKAMDKSYTLLLLYSSSGKML